MDSDLQHAADKLANRIPIDACERQALAEAARKYANIHPSRLHGWHILHVRAGSWGLTHPLDCDLTDCDYQTQAETWDEPPDELGNYQWEHEPVSESWVGVTEAPDGQ